MQNLNQIFKHYYINTLISTNLKMIHTECIALLQPCISGRPPFGELPPIQRAPPAAFPRPRSDTERHNINMLTSEGHFRCTMHYRIVAEKYFRPTIRKCKEDCALLFHCQCRIVKYPYIMWKCAQCTIMHSTCNLNLDISALLRLQSTFWQKASAAA